MREVIPHLPPGPFSLRDFTDHATGMNAVDNLREVEPFLEQLIAEHTICRLGKNIALWVVVGDMSSATESQAFAASSRNTPAFGGGGWPG